ncbi:Tat pathway signal sequence [uncultured Slackia sp.]|uniref:Tat pathway signal sequence n=1 Tax=uncultured Slackia sp. TaxID=665903 RepID=UPI0026E0F97B|nr:Tat pathway signal sequence [uncultured Slackia sp.]
MANNQNPFFTMFGVDDPFGAGGPQGASQGAPHVEFDTTAEFNNLKEKFESMGKKAAIVSAVIAVIVLAVAYWWFHPPINIHSVDTWFFVAVVILLPSFLFFRAKSRAYKTGTAKVSSSAGKAKTFKLLSFIPAGVFVLFILGTLLSVAFFPGNAQKYADILQTNDMEFTQDIQEVDYNEIPVIDRASAALLGNRTMGAMSDLVSQFEISPLYSQINYQDHPVRVSPLTYADLFKWLQNREQGIPAYVVVDMTSQDAEVVRLGGDKTIKYSESEPLARNIDRYVQLKYPFYMFGEKSFEIDDEGNAWWICPVRDFTIGLFGGETVSRAVLVNASTGECQDLAVDEVPEWVDRVYPASLLIQQYNWSGKYKDGWFNSWLGQNGVVQTTPGTDGTLGYNYLAKDDDVWMYTGVTSATGDNSIVGFVLVNQRTAESHFYSVAGATEDSAMQSAEGQVQNLRYHATFPILINVNNTPTYFMALKDDAGLVKKYAMVDIRSYQNVAVGDTVADTQKSYISLIAASGSAETPAEGQSFAEANGKIKTIAQAVIEGNSHFYMTLEGDARIYDFALPAMVDVVSYGVGDTIALRYTEGDPTSVVQEIVENAAAAADAADEDAAAAEAEPKADTADGSVEAAGQANAA